MLEVDRGIDRPLVEAVLEACRCGVESRVHNESLPSLVVGDLGEPALEVELLSHVVAALEGHGDDPLAGLLVAVSQRLVVLVLGLHGVRETAYVGLPMGDALHYPVLRRL